MGKIMDIATHSLLANLGVVADPLG